MRSDAAKGEDKKKTTGAGPAAAVKQEVKEEARQEARQDASEEALVRRRNQLLQVGPQSKYIGRDETGWVYLPIQLECTRNFTGDGKCSERGWACTPHPQEPGLILPSWWNVHQKTAVTTLCTLWVGPQESHHYANFIPLQMKGRWESNIKMSGSDLCIARIETDQLRWFRK